MRLSDDEWKKKLTPQQYHVMREKGTEYPGSGKYIETSEGGLYHCAACGQELFRSDKKFDGSWMSGWPNFSDPVNRQHLNFEEDHSFGMERIAVSCANCGGHLGHVFEDDLGHKGSRYCINSCALDFKPSTKPV